MRIRIEPRHFSAVVEPAGSGRLPRREADRAAGLVVQRYPKSPKAATALYKRALSMKAAGQTAAARAGFDRIIREYPRSDEAALAREQLRSIK